MHPGKLLLGCRCLAGRLPFFLRHPVDEGAGRRCVAIKPGLHDPVSEAIAAEPGQPHQVDILRIMAVLQMAYQMAKSGGRNGIGQIVEPVLRV